MGRIGGFWKRGFIWLKRHLPCFTRQKYGRKNIDRSFRRIFVRHNRGKIFFRTSFHISHQGDLLLSEGASHKTGGRCKISESSTVQFHVHRSLLWFGSFSDISNGTLLQVACAPSTSTIYKPVVSTQLNKRLIKLDNFPWGEQKNIFEKPIPRNIPNLPQPWTSNMFFF